MSYQINNSATAPLPIRTPASPSTVRW